MACTSCSRDISNYLPFLSIYKEETQEKYKFIFCSHDWLTYPHRNFFEKVCSWVRSWLWSLLRGFLLSLVGSDVRRPSLSPWVVLSTRIIHGTSVRYGTQRQGLTGIEPHVILATSSSYINSKTSPLRLTKLNHISIKVILIMMCIVRIYRCTFLLHRKETFWR